MLVYLFYSVNIVFFLFALKAEVKLYIMSMYCGLAIVSVSRAMHIHVHRNKFTYRIIKYCLFIWLSRETKKKWSINHAVLKFPLNRIFFSCRYFYYLNLFIRFFFCYFECKHTHWPGYPNTLIYIMDTKINACNS